jgi:hypothetical protein
MGKEDCLASLEAMTVQVSDICFGRETPLPLRGISPKGAKILYYLVELHLDAEFFPPFRGNTRGFLSRN